jgi:hypothetical protein
LYLQDCTAEGLKAVLELRSLSCIREALQQTGEAREDAAAAAPEQADDRQRNASISKRPLALPDISEERLQEAVTVLLTLQNQGSGGWATYENTRGWAWYGALNDDPPFSRQLLVKHGYLPRQACDKHKKDRKKAGCFFFFSPSSMLKGTRSSTRPRHLATS